MGSQPIQTFAVRYRGFLILLEANNTWLIRPERSPMQILPFRTHASSLEEAKTVLDLRLSEQNNLIEAA